MILPDVNTLVFAFRAESERHDLYREWLGDVVAGSDDLALTDPVVVGFLRVVTNPRIFADPAPLKTALDLVGALSDARRALWLPHTDASWVRFGELATADRGVRGNLVPDAWIAAQALAHGCRVATADRGFARFEGLEWFDPGAAR